MLDNVILFHGFVRTLGNVMLSNCYIRTLGNFQQYF